MQRTREFKNYIVVHYNNDFHDNNIQDKERHLRQCIFSEYEIKEVCFNTHKKPMAYVYFGKDGEAQKAVNAFLDSTLPNPFAFKIQLGQEKNVDVNKTKIRSIIIDGESVAREHGIGRLFSTQGLKIAIEYFASQRYSDVKVVLSEKRLDFSSADIPVLNKYALNELINNSRIIVTKNGIYDEKFIKELVIKNGSMIVSNDKFRNDQFRNSPEIVSYFNGPNILQFAFNDDEFSPLDGPTKLSKTDLSPNMLDDDDLKHEEPNEIGFNRVYIKYLPKAFNERAKIKQLLESYGAVQDVFIYQNPNNSFTGCCTVTFVNDESAKKAVNDMNGRHIENSNLTVERYIPKNERSERLGPNQLSAHTLYIWPIRNNVTKETLNKIFGRYGFLLNDIKLENNKNFAFVSYRNKNSADLAIESLNGKMCQEISDIAIKVDYKTSKH